VCPGKDGDTGAAALEALVLDEDLRSVAVGARLARQHVTDLGNKFIIWFEIYFQFDL